MALALDVGNCSRWKLGLPFLAKIFIMSFGIAVLPWQWFYDGV